MSADSTSSSPGLDLRPLSDPVDRVEAQGYREHLVARGLPRGREKSLRIYLMCGLLVILFGTASVYATRLWELMLTVPVAAVGLIGLAGQFRKDSPGYEYRLFKFAQANGLIYEPAETGAPLPGMIFNHGLTRKVLRKLYTEDTTPMVEFGDFQSQTGGGRNVRFHRWGYIAIRLHSPASQMVLDAKNTRALDTTGLPRAIADNHQVPLGNGYDDHFTLYCPAGHEQEALKLFTPELLRRLHESPGQFDIEVVDDWLFVYTMRHFVNPNPRDWSWVSSLALDLIAATERWRGRSDPAPETVAETLPVVSQPGQRMTTSRYSSRHIWTVVACVSVVMVMGLVFGR